MGGEGSDPKNGAYVTLIQKSPGNRPADPKMHNSLYA
jgi:hypothetical protein